MMLDAPLLLVAAGAAEMDEAEPDGCAMEEVAISCALLLAAEPIAVLTPASGPALVTIGEATNGEASPSP